MYRSLISTRYAKSLILKGQEDNILVELHSDIRFLQKCLQENRDLYDVLHQPTVSISKKINIISGLFESRISPVSVNFLKLIINNRREYYIEDIFRNFFDLYNEVKGIKRAILTTTVALEEKEQKEVKSFIEKNFNANEINLEVNIDKDLIGGFIIQITDQLYDVSIRRQLELIEKAFLQKNL